MFNNGFFRNTLHIGYTVQCRLMGASCHREFCIRPENIRQRQSFYRFKQLVERFYSKVAEDNSDTVDRAEFQIGFDDGAFIAFEIDAAVRSEEHTSELQSRFELVWRLLLEKKNT